MDTTTILPTPPTSGAIVHSGYDRRDNRSDDFFGVWAGLNETHRTGTATIDAINQSTNVINKGVYDASVAGIKQTTDYGIANADTTNRNATAVTKAVTDAALSASLEAARIHNEVIAANGNLRGVILDASNANALAHKDTQLQICRESDSIRTEMLKGFHSTQLEALKNKCDLEAKLAECCCETKALILEQAQVTRALIEGNEKERLRDVVAELRADLRHTDKAGK